MPNNLSAAGVFLISTLINMYVMVMLMRVLLPFVRANFYNPISQFIVALTDPIIKPLRRVVPSYKKIDLPVILLLFLVQFLKLTILFFVTRGTLGNPFGISIWVVGDTLDQLTTMYFYAIIIRVVLSWVSAGGYVGASPLQEILFLITEPVLRPFRRFIPPIAGIDLSPLVLMISIKLIEIIFIYPVIGFGVALAL